MSQYIAGWYSVKDGHPTHIDNYQKIQKFEGDLNNELTVDYLMGIFDANGQININDKSCSLCINNTKLQKNIEDYILSNFEIPYKIIDNTIVFQQSNAVDFLGKLYQEIIEKD